MQFKIHNGDTHEISRIDLYYNVCSSNNERRRRLKRRYFCASVS